jgi:ABC-type sugar transport system permease subunit
MRAERRPLLSGATGWFSLPIHLPRAGPLPWLLPALALVALVLMYPSIRSIYLSFTDQTTFIHGQWVGVDNYDELRRDPLFWRSFRNNAILLISVPVSVVVALLICAILYRGVVGRRFYETAIFLPFLPAVASVGAIFIYLLGPTGPVNNALSDVGLGSVTGAWLADPNLAIWSILGVVTWKRIGFTVLLFMARLTSLDRSHFEAAAVDGASWSRAYWRVAVPQMSGIIRFAVVLGFIEVFSWTFAFVFILTRGGPNQSTFTLDFLLYDLLFTQQLVGLACAVAVVLLVAALLVALYRIRLARLEGEF